MLYYSHINEDNRVERQLMSRSTFTNLWCIVGSGERLISLMDVESLKNIYAIDINPEALYLLKIKLAALQHLSVPQYLEFLGMRETDKSKRVEMFSSFREALSDDCRQYWDNHPAAIKKGILHCGHFEQFLSRIRPLLRISLGSGFYACFEQALPDCKQFPHRRWGWLKTIFAHRLPYQILGNQDDAFISKNAQRSVIPNALQEVLDRDIVDRSFMFHLVFKGHLQNMPEEELPPSLQPLVLQKIKTKLEMNQLKIHYQCGDLLKCWNDTASSIAGPTFFSLSDLLSFTDFNYIKSFCESVYPRTDNGSFFVLRAFLRHQLDTEQLNWLKDHFATVCDLSKEELTTMYKVYAFGDEQIKI